MQQSIDAQYDFAYFVASLSIFHCNCSERSNDGWCVDVHDVVENRNAPINTWLCFTFNGRAKRSRCQTISMSCLNEVSFINHAMTSILIDYIQASHNKTDHWSEQNSRKKHTHTSKRTALAGCLFYLDSLKKTIRWYCIATVFKTERIKIQFMPSYWSNSTKRIVVEKKYKQKKQHQTMHLQRNNLSSN